MNKSGIKYTLVAVLSLAALLAFLFMPIHTLHINDVEVMSATGADYLSGEAELDTSGIDSALGTRLGATQKLEKRGGFYFLIAAAICGIVGGLLKKSKLARLTILGAAIAIFNALTMGDSVTSFGITISEAAGFGWWIACACFAVAAVFAIASGKEVPVETPQEPAQEPAQI